MSGLSIIYHKRLKKIRKELDSYIELRFSRKEGILPTADTDWTKVERLQDKFLNCMKLSLEDSDDEDGIDDADSADRSGEDKCRKRLAIDKVLAQKKESFSSMLLRLIDERGLKDSEVYKSANIDRRLFSKIRSDKDYVPSKKTAISFCLALQLEMEETNKLLETAGYTLSASSRFDLIIMYLIENGECNVHFANIVLNDYGEGTLSR